MFVLFNYAIRFVHLILTSLDKEIKNNTIID